MNKIEILYENAGVEKDCKLYGNYSMCPYKTRECTDCKYFIYPPFTAEKQLDIVKCILFSTWWMNLKRLQFAENFEEALAGLINDLWQDLTEEEKDQIRGILNGN